MTGASMALVFLGLGAFSLMKRYQKTLPYSKAGPSKLALQPVEKKPK